MFAKPLKLEDDKFDLLLDNFPVLFKVVKSFELFVVDRLDVLSFSFKFDAESFDDSFVREPNAINPSDLNS